MHPYDEMELLCDMAKCRRIVYLYELKYRGDIFKADECMRVSSKMFDRYMEITKELISAGYPLPA